MYIETVPNRNSRPATPLREGWREGAFTIERSAPHGHVDLLLVMSPALGARPVHRPEAIPRARPGRGDGRGTSDASGLEAPHHHP